MFQGDSDHCFRVVRRTEGRQIAAQQQGVRRAGVGEDPLQGVEPAVNIGHANHPHGLCRPAAFEESVQAARLAKIAGPRDTECAGGILLCSGGSDEARPGGRFIEGTRLGSRLSREHPPVGNRESFCGAGANGERGQDQAVPRARGGVRHRGQRHLSRPPPLRGHRGRLLAHRCGAGSDAGRTGRGPCCGSCWPTYSSLPRPRARSTSCSTPASTTSSAAWNFRDTWIFCGESRGRARST